MTKIETKIFKLMSHPQVQGLSLREITALIFPKDSDSPRCLQIVREAVRALREDGLVENIAQQGGPGLYVSKVGKLKH